MLSVPVWLFDSVTANAPLVVPIPWLGNGTCLGETSMFCACNPAQENNASKRKPHWLLVLEITGTPWEIESI
jgi:hypothetical protein